MALERYIGHKQYNGQTDQRNDLNNGKLFLENFVKNKGEKKR